MADLKKLIPDKRRGTVLVIIIFLLLISLIPYLFYYIPLNEARLHESGFQKLSRAKTNILEKNINLKPYYKSKPGSGSITLAPEDLLICNGNRQLPKAEKRENGYLYFYSDSANVWNLFYLKNKKGEKWNGDTLSVRQFIEPCLTSSKEFFEAFMLIHYCDSPNRIIYQDAQNSVDQRIVLDSLMPIGSRGMRSPDIFDIRLQGINYKMFSCPLQLNGHCLMLCGFLKQKQYNAYSHTIPVGVAYPLVILFLLFILSLPLLKIFMMNENERVGIWDLINAGLVVFAGAALVTIIVIQVLLLWGGNRRVDGQLSALSGQIADSLISELKPAERQLRSFDSSLAQYIKSHPGYLQGDPAADSLLKDSVRYIPVNINNQNDSGVQVKKLALLYDSLAPYQYFDRASWVNAGGMQIFKAEVYTGTGFLDVRERKYYKFFRYKSKTDSAASLNALLMIDPIYSWANGEFRINLCIKSQVPGALLATLATRLYSLVNVILPAGYGYCLIDADGTVLVHSDTVRNLAENFLAETGQQRWIKEAITSRQTDSSDNVHFYGNTNAVHVQPLSRFPLFLVTFYNNDFMIPVYLRILAFSLLFCLLTYLILFVLLFVFQRYRARSFLFATMDYFNWMVPHKKSSGFYCNASIFLALYAIVFLIAGVLFRLINDYVVLLVALMTPLNLLCVLRILKLTDASNDNGHADRKLALILTGGLLLTGSFFFWRTRLYESTAYWQYIGIELCVIASMLVMIYGDCKNWKLVNSWRVAVLKLIAGWRDKGKRDWHLVIYSIMVVLLIITFAVIPAAVYTWFAHNHEIIQSVKKDQLYLANSLQKRERSIRSFLNNNHHLPAGYFDTIQYHKGIYTIHKDIVLCARNCSRHDSLEQEGSHANRSELFYLNTANDIGLNYDDPYFFPALKDSSDDNLWHWQIVNSSTIFFDYTRPSWKQPEQVNQLPPVDIKIRSAIPHRYVFLGSGAGLVLIIVFILLVLAGLYKLIRSIVSRLFLLKFVLAASNDDGITAMDNREGAGAWYKPYQQTRDDDKVRDLFKNGCKSLREEYPAMSASDLPAALVKKEQELTARTAGLTPLFDAVWQACTDHEKLLLFDLAEDGLMNYKNEPLIYKLFRDKLLIVDDERVKPVGYSFRHYIISRKAAGEDKKIIAAIQTGATWASMRNIFVLIVLAALVFLFLTQQEVSGKIIALVTSLTTIVPLLLKVFASSGGDAAVKK